MVPVRGNGCSGAGSPRRSQIGSPPSVAVHSSNCSEGTLATLALWRSSASHGNRIVQLIAEAVMQEPAESTHPRLQVGRRVGDDQEDRVRPAAIPAFGVAYRQEYECVWVGCEEFGPEARTRPVDRRHVGAQKRRPVDRSTVDRVRPSRDLVGILKDLGHVVTRTTEQLLQGELQRVRPGRANPCAHDPQCHLSPRVIPRSSRCTTTRHHRTATTISTTCHSTKSGATPALQGRRCSTLLREAVADSVVRMSAMTTCRASAGRRSMVTPGDLASPAPRHPACRPVGSVGREAAARPGRDGAAA